MPNADINGDGDINILDIVMIADYITGQIIINTVFILVLLSIGIAQDYTYTLEDVNENSDYYGQTISPFFFPNEITIHYFGKQT